MSQLDEDDLERSHELQRRIQRDDEREQHQPLTPRLQSRYIARVTFRPIAEITERRQAS